MKWLVLSDLHLNFKNCTTTNARKALIEHLKKERKENGDFSFILITGDCMYQHNSNPEVEAAYIKQIAEACGTPIQNIFMCAGNHDVDRNNGTRNQKIERIRDGELLYNINDFKSGYGEFGILHHAATERFYKHFNVDSIGNCRIVTIDSCLLSKDDNDFGNLGVCFQEFSELDTGSLTEESINIVIMHHGVTWLNPKDSRVFQHWMADNKIDVVFCGHNHLEGVEVLTEGIPEMGFCRHEIKQFTCGAILYDKYSQPSFYIGEIDECRKLKVKLYVYQNNSKWGIGRDILRGFPEGIHECSLSYIKEESALRNIDIKKTNNQCVEYDTIFDANNDMANDLKDSSFMDFFGMRGGTFLRENSIISDVLYSEKKDVKCRILVSHPYSDTIEHRLKMVPEFKSRDMLEKRWKEIYEDIGRLKDNISELINGEMRFHEQPLAYRFIITDNSLYLGYYEEKNSSKSAIYRYGAETALYQSMRSYFNNVWTRADMSYENKVPDKCSFLLGKFNMMPSLVVNVTDKCNMHCRYCPNGGENLEKCETLCGVNEIKLLMTYFINYCEKQGWKDKKVIRITGGEPLLEENKLMEILSHAVKKGYKKIVLCTNGILLKDVYENNFKIWNSVKDILLFKISLDSLKENIFDELTGTNNQYLDKVTKNIEFINEEGFKIELNFVATKDNVGEIESVYEYASRIGLVGVKVLTINDFGERVMPEDVSHELEQLINRMRDKGYVERDLYVHNNKGILMKRFIHNNCMLTIVDHTNNVNSITPRRTYSQSCQDCKYYPDSKSVEKGLNKPCATGIMSLTMRADGVLSSCRLRIDSGESLAKKTSGQIKKVVRQQMENFCECYHVDSKIN